MSLNKYWGKRDFKQTPEPRGQVKKTADQLAFFIQKHDASHLHYDFRLELGGTLKSWAIPKGPSFNPANKRLAVHVEDHPIDYGTFEGVIPEGHYGAGTVIVWDKGTWIPKGKAEAGYREGHLKFQLVGEKLQGDWALVRMGKPVRDGKENWLLIKERDEYAQSAKDAEITTVAPESVLSGDAAVSATPKPTVKKRSKDDEKPLASKTPISARAEAGARKTAMQHSFKPQLASLTEQAPQGDEWIYEVKFDGYRALARVEKSAAAIFTRAGNDWTKKWPSIAEALKSPPVQQAWLDGEIVAIDAHGKINFQALQNFAQTGETVRLVYYVFDIVYLDGYELTAMPLLERKRLLQGILTGMKADFPIVYNDHLVGDAANVFHHACLHELEGIVVKRADSSYMQSRSRSWLKLKCRHRQEFVIAGYTEPQGSRTDFGALLIGVYDEQHQLRYAGRVGTGFKQETLASLSKKFKSLSVKTMPLAEPPTDADLKNVHWLRPELVAEVNFAEWTTAGVVRHASFIALRSDKSQSEIERERPVVPPTKAETEKTEPKKPELDKAQTQPAKNEVARSATVAGIALTHASRVLFPGAAWTKLNLAQYYESVSEWLLPHLQHRPLSLVRCPQGQGTPCFFQKHVSANIPAEIGHIKIPGGDNQADYMVADTLPAVIGLVQMGVLEHHTWGSSKGKLTQPDRIIFDLDPAEDLAWPMIVEGAHLVRALLTELGLISFVKTTGGKGLHIAVPIKAEHEWPEIKAFSKGIAEHLEQTFPERFTAKISKSKRNNKIFIDYLRNSSGATGVAAFSTRARPNAPVSTPIAWEELEGDVRANSFNLGNIQARLTHLKMDPWEDYFRLQQKISAKMLRLFVPE